MLHAFPASRRAFVAGLSTAAAVSVLSPAVAQTGPPIRILTVGSDGGALAIYAKEAGFFSRAGLNVEVTTATSGSVILAALAGGAVELADANVASLAAGVLNGLPFTVIADCSLYTAKKPTVLLCTGLNSTIKAAKDLAGKKIATNGLRNVSQAAVQAWLDHNGVDSKSVGFLETAFSAMGEMAESGRVDAVLIAEPALSLARSKLRVIGSPYDIVAPQFSLSSYGANTDWVAKNRALASRVVAAMRQTAVWANANQEKSGKILVDVLKMSDAVVSSMTRCEYPPTLEAANLQSSIDIMAKYGYLAKRIDANTLITRV